MFQDCIKQVIKGCVLTLSLLAIGFYSVSLFGTTGTDSETTAVAEPFVEGKQYQRLAPAIITSKNVQELITENPGKIEVVEFFSYACFWCQRLHPLVNEWVKKKPENVVFYRFPIIFNRSWEPLAKAYYIVKLLGKSETLDQAFFKAVHQDHLNLADEKILKQFFIDNGVTEQEFNDLYNSFTVSRELAKGDELSKSYQLAASPVLIVNTPSGSYLLTVGMAGGEEPLFKLLDYIIAKNSEKKN